MTRIAVGVDAGGTSTAVAVSRDGAFLGEHFFEGASASALGAGEAARRIARAVESAVAPGQPAAIYAGAAGAGREGVAQAIEAELALLFPAAKIFVTDDARIVLRAVRENGAGIVLVAGTGSIAYAQDAAGASFRAGGYGYLLGDDGSGFAIGLAAARHLARVLDGRSAADALSEQTAQSLEAATQAALFDRIYGDPERVSSLASLAKRVIEQAGAGVRSAHKIVQTAALELSDLVKVAAKKAQLQHETVPLVLSGGLFKENSVLTFLLETRLQADLPGAEILKNVQAHRGALAAAEAMLR